jgi:membrane fusion protein (multidrug efflux system)
MIFPSVAIIKVIAVQVLVSHQRVLLCWPPDDLWGYTMRPSAHTVALLGFLAATTGGVAQEPTAIPVGTVAAQLRPITQTTEFVGRIEAAERVEIRARVTGYLDGVLFKEGDLAKQGDVLYRIEPDSFQVAVQQAQGAVLEAQAELANATAQLARTQELVKTDTASRALLDERQGKQKEAQGGVVIADANLKTANVNLGYMEITSPITGEVGRTKVTKGNVVGPDTGPLTVVGDPIYVTFPVSQRVFLNVEEEAARKAKGQGLAVRIRFSNGTTYDQVGRINFVDVQWTVRRTRSWCAPHSPTRTAL